jgi:D-serine dehydratase
MLLRLAALDGRPASVREIGLTNTTEADGLAVAKASELAAKSIGTLVSGIFTVSDADLLTDLYRLHQAQQIRIEPSAAAAFRGPNWLLSAGAGRQYLEQHCLDSKLDRTTHILWTTGGGLVPEREYHTFLERGRAAYTNRSRTARHS